MKTRIIHTKIWEDDWFASISRSSRIIFLYLLTCPQNNLCGIFELPDRVLSFNAVVTQAEIETAKTELAGRVVFHNGWVKLLKSDRYNNYISNKDMEKALQKELDIIPEEILKNITDSIPRDTPRDNPRVYPPNNNKEEIINNNKGGVGGKKFGNIDSIDKTVIDEIAKQYNVSVQFVDNQYQTMTLWCSSKGKSYKNYKAALQNWVRGEKEKKPEKAGIYKPHQPEDEAFIKLMIEREQHGLATNQK